MSEIYTLSEKTIRKLRDDHFALMRMVRDLVAKVSGDHTADDNNTLLFRNAGSEQVPAYGVMRITGFDATYRVFTVDKPNTTFQREYLVNGAQPVSSGASGYCFHMGTPCEVLVNSGTPAYGESWGPVPSTWGIAKWRYGFTIHGGNSTTPASRTWATQKYVDIFRGKTDSSHAKGATGTISIYDGNKVDTTDNMSSVTNDFAAVGSGKWVFVKWVGGLWCLVSAEC